MAIPLADAGRIVEAMSKFDREKRFTADWQGWEMKRNFKYALVKCGVLYPPKEIIGLATGISKASFGGGRESNEYLRKLGFQVERLMHSGEPRGTSAREDHS